MTPLSVDRQLTVRKMTPECRSADSWLSATEQKSVGWKRMKSVAFPHAGAQPRNASGSPTLSSQGDMIQRVVFITVVQLMLYAILIPMRIAYETSCQLMGSSCGNPTASRMVQSQKAVAFKPDLPPQ
jgi:hypothetical protein